MGGNRTTSLRRLIELLGEALNVTPRIDVRPEQPGDVRRTCADVAEAAAALRAGRPDLVVWLGRGGVLARFLGHIRRALPNVPILGGDAVAAGGMHEARPATREGIRAVEHVDLDATDALRAFGRRYRDRFGRDPTGPDALTYDAVRLVIAGVRHGARTGRELRAYLEALGREAPPYAGLTGPIAFDENGDVQRTYVLRAIGPPDVR